MAEADPQHLMQWPAADLAGLMHVINAMPGRHIAIPGTLNFRDAGGYPLAGGGVIGWRRLLRSDGLHRLDGTSSHLLGSIGLRTVMDLRTGYEADIAPSPLDELARQGALTMHVSLIGEDLADLPAELGDIYRYIIDERGAEIGAVIRALARPGGLPGLVHCTAGKDRTGIAVALTLAAVGVPDHVVAADYALSSVYLDPQHTPTIGHVRESSGLGDRLTVALLASPPQLILDTLARARRRGGSLAGYLADCGVSAADLKALRSALTLDGLTQDGERDGGSG